MKFEELDLNDNVLDALYDMHFEECTPVQEKCIPEILKGRDVLGVAQTGTGKTAAYLLPVLSKLADGGYPEDAINCVVMSPTRELAQQIDQAMQGFSYYLDGVSSVAVYGGNDGARYDNEVKSLRLGADVIIATPGRLISHISMGNVDMSKVSFFILDEADRMLDMGFSDDIMKIAKELPADCQTIMFSATMPPKIEELAKTLLKNPVEVKLAVSKPAEKIQQSAYICYETQKRGIIQDIFKKGDLKRVLIFCGSKMKVKAVAGALQRMKINCGEMHSDLEQAERDEMMFKFKSGQYDVLVATDILSRGIDIDDISMVINYDVPHDCEDYVHRIGRTARAERDGVAITLVSEDDMYWFQQIERFLGKEIQKNPLPDNLGEGPEYKPAGKPRGNKTSAKSRRRKDRDQTSHKDRKQNNRRRSHNREAGDQPADTTTEQSQDRSRRQRPHTNSRPNRRTGDSQEENHQGRTERRTDRKANPNNAERQDRKPRQKRRGNVEGNYKKRQNSTERKEKRVAASPKSSSQTSKNQEGAVKKFFKRLFGIK